MLKCRLVDSIVMICIFFFFFFLELSDSAKQDETNMYQLCRPFPCGNFVFTFPFSNSDTFGTTGQYSCGLPKFKIYCHDSGVPKVELSDEFYEIIAILTSDRDRLLTVFDRQLTQSVASGSCNSIRNFSIPAVNSEIVDPTLTFATGVVNLTIFKCPSRPNGIAVDGGIAGSFKCAEEGDKDWAYVWNSTQLGPAAVPKTPDGCTYTFFPISGASLPKIRSGGNQTWLSSVLNDGFVLQWQKLAECSKCIMDFGGRCVYDATSSTQIACFCDNGLLCGSKTKTKPNSNRWKLIVICVSAGIGLALVSLFSLFLLNNKRKKSLAMSSFSLHFGTEKQAKGEEAKRNAREFIKAYQSTVMRSYTYNDLNKMTNGFKQKLGKGGFGSVFKGILQDDTPIAVKMLENYGDHERSDFLNEIATISMIRHFNIIRLLGFSWDGSKQALIYEFMPNGSIGDLLGSRSLIRPRKLLEIAMGVAHGIEYLHIGCEARILHLDIKPQNILLDDNLNPKISDFGLAMTYSRNRSAITISGGAKGTIGYIAPEIFMGNFGKPSDKSDVYSFGMLLLEMVGAKDRPLDHEQKEGGSSSSNDYFPNWVYEKLLVMEEIIELGEEDEEDTMIKRKIAMVGLWCIQINPRNRPSMTKVVEMLSANMNAIEMPPKPLSFFSSGQQQLDYEITSFRSEDSTLPLTGEIIELGTIWQSNVSVRES